jgi:hypothetical protein
MKLCFSYCLYGKFNPKYYVGLEKNIEYILKRFPDSCIYLWFGSDVEDQYFEKYNKNDQIRIIKKKDETGHIMMSYRFASIDFIDCDVMLVRDADSRISDREIILNEDFFASQYLLHTIRDHRGHHIPLMGGAFSVKKELMTKYNIKILNIIKYYKMKNIKLDYYNSDQNLLVSIFYNNFKHLLLVHSTKNIFSDINFIKINPPEDNNFCGQVIDYDQSGNEFMVHEYKNYD